MTDTATPQELHDALRTTAPWAFTGRSPDPGELMEWLDQQTQPIALAYLGVVLRNAERGAVCVMAEHENLLRELRHQARQIVAQTTRALRYRTAWYSARRRAARLARRRAARLASVLDDGPPLELVVDETTETVTWQPPTHTADLVSWPTLTDGRRYWPCDLYSAPFDRLAFVHTAGPCQLDHDEAEPVEDTTGHPRHTDDLRAPSLLLKWDNDRPWWVCHRTGLIHTEGPCILRTDPLDLRAGQGPIQLDRDPVTGGAILFGEK